MHNLKTNFDKILAIVAEFHKNIDLPVRRAGRPSKFSDIKVIALALTAESLSIDSENLLFSKLRSNYSSDFPDLVHRSNFNIRARKLRDVIEAIRSQIAQKIAGSESVFSIDSMPVPICRIVRSKRLKICRENDHCWPASGYCATQKQFYHGYKLHALVGINGVIDMYDLSAANVHDLHYLNDVRMRKTDCCILGDKAYDARPTQLSLFEQNNIRLMAPARAYKDRSAYFPKPLSRMRKRVETTFSQLCDQFNIKRNYAKSFSGLAARTIRKISAFTLLQYINSLANRARNQIKHALA
jgi:hypothetical protein